MALMNQLKEILTPMFSKKPLPEHVIAKGKTSKPRHYFAPRRNLPQNWPPTIRLPIDGEFRDLGIENKIYWINLNLDAARLNEKLEKERYALLKNLPPKQPTTIPDLLRWWENQSDHWRTLKPRMRTNYQLKFKYLLAWSETIGNPHVKEISTAMLRVFINSGVLKPALMDATRATLSAILSHAVEMGLINENPCLKLATFKRPKSPKSQIIRIWTKKDVEIYVQAALDFNWLGGAIMIQGLWECGGRITDATKWKISDLNGRFLAYSTNKSDENKIAIAYMSQKFCNLAKMVKGKFFLVTQPHNDRGVPIDETKTPDPLLPYTEEIDDNRLKTHFRSVQRRAMAMGAAHLALKHLRHSAITDADNKGIKHSDLKANTTHTTETMAKERYIIANRAAAKKIATKRGIK